MKNKYKKIDFYEKKYIDICFIICYNYLRNPKNQQNERKKQMDTNENQKQLALDLLLGDVVKKAQTTATDEVTKLREDLIKEMTQIRSNLETIKTEVAEVLSETGTVVNLGTVEEPKKEKAHKAFGTITKALAAAKRKEKNIMLVGGAGGGKTHLVKQIAEALKLPFYPMSVGMQTTKSDLLGFINAHGQYMPSIVRQAYENGGVLLLDEFDAAHAGVVTILNSLLANGHASFPDKVIQKHKDFVCLVACNTFGNGASLEYVGRNRLDGATLDRFIVIEVDYDAKLEKTLTNNDFWYGIIKKIRSNADKCGIKLIISPRASMDGADLLDAGFTVKEVLNMTVFKGCNEEIVKKLSQGVSFEKQESTDVPKKEVDIDAMLDKMSNEHDFVFHITEHYSDMFKGQEYDFDAGRLYISQGLEYTGLNTSRDWFGISTRKTHYEGTLNHVSYQDDGCITPTDYQKILEYLKEGIKSMAKDGAANSTAIVFEAKGRHPVFLSTKTGGDYNA